MSQNWNSGMYQQRGNKSTRRRWNISKGHEQSQVSTFQGWDGTEHARRSSTSACSHEQVSWVNYIVPPTLFSPRKRCARVLTPQDLGKWPWLERAGLQSENDITGVGLKSSTVGLLIGRGTWQRGKVTWKDTGTVIYGPRKNLEQPFPHSPQTGQILHTSILLLASRLLSHWCLSHSVFDILLRLPWQTMFAKRNFNWMLGKATRLARNEMR